MNDSKNSQMVNISQKLNKAYQKNPGLAGIIAWLTVLLAVLWSPGNRPSTGESANEPTAIDQSEIDSGLKLFNSALSDGKYDLAEIYLINAIQRDTSNIETIEQLEKLVGDNHSFNSLALDRIVSLAESLLFKVSPEDISRLESLISKLRTKDLSVAIAPKDINIPKLLEQGPKSPIDLQSIAIYMGQLDRFLETTDEGEELTSEVKERRDAWFFASQLHDSLAFVKSCLGNIETLEKSQRLDSRAAVSIVQAAENASAAFWSVPIDKLPSSYKEKVEKYPNLIQQKVDEIAKARSQHSLQLIKGYEKSARSQLKATRIETRCRELESAIQNIQQELPSVPSQVVQKEVGDTLQALASLLREQRRIQTDRYQSHTLRKCVSLAAEFQDETIVSAADAKNLFNKHKLAEVDQTLLSPEVSQCFNDILRKLFGELSPEEIVGLQKLMGDASKKTKLEAF